MAKNCKAINNKCSKCKLSRKTREDNRQDANTVKDSEDESVNAIFLHHMASSSPQQIKQIVWCNTRNRYTQQMSPAVTPLKLEIETYHNVDLGYLGNTVQVAKQQAPAVLIMWVDTTSVRCYQNYHGIEVDSRLIRCK